MAAKKKPKKNDAMLGALAASFGSPKPSAENIATEPAGTSETTEKGRGEEPVNPPTASEPVAAAPPEVLPVPAPVKPLAKKKDLRPLPENVGVKKTTVSFHPAEQDKIDQILDTLLHSRRHRGGFSDAIKIALRLCPIDSEEIAKAWDLARAQDLRIARHRKDS